ncbi:MAG: hypothetical protein II499_08765 [Firmicutes bacterium]|nr:hypothetical protein [Bacillota bacterium]MBQ1887059.1 hypothetical protein [Bacillota bacterium]MBQ2456170.1 hypothetical protein [Bacillota bacterium]MBQ4234316.1 hypothetical protein [Bacillota bacterium]MBQ5437456.1 hypothetical protein [Bacillota bacterium]
MAGKTIDTEALRSVRTALRTYRSAVMSDVKKMRDAAKDCRDNLGNDEYSKRTVADLNDSLKDILAAIEKADELEQKITKKIGELEGGVI